MAMVERSDPVIDRRGGDPGSTRVVVIDDTPVFRTMWRATLEGTGRYRIVAEAEDGSGGLSVCLEEQPDAVITDLRMPNGSGLDLIRALRTAHLHALIVLSSSELLSPDVAEEIRGLDVVCAAKGHCTELLSILDARFSGRDADRADQSG
jgi:DNA-binding NarL/FixJ family response regulator